MNKLCGSSKLIGHLALDNSVEDNLSQAAKALQKNISELKIIVMDRERHIDLISNLKDLGAQPILIGDGDVSGLKAAEGSVDLLYGIGAAPEGVITATAVKAMGGFFEGRLHFMMTHLKKGP